MKKNRRALLRLSGFTLLEVIIVIIIVGVLASLALPRFFRMIEGSRAAEAFAGIQAIRGALERCYLMRRTYSGCGDFLSLSIENPANAPGAKFSYVMTNLSSTGYAITATRNTRDGGDGISQITLKQDQEITYDGSSVFSHFQN